MVCWDPGVSAAAKSLQVPVPAFKHFLPWRRPQCTLYAQGMTFGGDFGLAVASNASSARAVLVCSAYLHGLCADCILPQHTGGPDSEPMALLIAPHWSMASNQQKSQDEAR